MTGAKRLSIYNGSEVSDSGCACVGGKRWGGVGGLGGYLTAD